MWLRRAASVVIVLATACTGTSQGGLVPSESHAPLAVETQTALTPRQVALAETKTLLGLARIPPGSERQSKPPVATLRKPAQAPSSPYLLDTNAWWTVSLDPDATWSWLQSHRPTGLEEPLVAVGRGGGSGRSPAGSFRYLIYAGHPTNQYTSPTLLIEIAPDGRGSAIRADGQVLWVPPKPPAEFVRNGVTQVRLVESDLTPGSPSKILNRAIVRGSRVSDLGRLANALLRDNRGLVSCTMDRGIRISATFEQGDGSTTLFTENPYCGSVTVKAGGEPQPPLLLSGPFASALRASLGSSLRIP